MSAQPRTSHGACGSLMWGLGRPLQRDCRSRPGSATNQLCIHPYSFQFRRNQLIKVVFSGYVQCEIRKIRVCYLFQFSRPSPESK